MLSKCWNNIVYGYFFNKQTSPNSKSIEIFNTMFFHLSIIFPLGGPLNYKRKLYKLIYEVLLVLQNVISICLNVNDLDDAERDEKRSCEIVAGGRSSRIERNSGTDVWRVGQRRETWRWYFVISLVVFVRIRRSKRRLCARLCAAWLAQPGTKCHKVTLTILQQLGDGRRRGRDRREGQHADTIIISSLSARAGQDLFLFENSMLAHFADAFHRVAAHAFITLH